MKEDDREGGSLSSLARGRTTEYAVCLAGMARGMSITTGMYGMDIIQMDRSSSWRTSITID